jgi:hypothetical protein
VVAGGKGRFLLLLLGRGGGGAGSLGGRWFSSICLCVWVRRVYVLCGIASWDDGKRMGTLHSANANHQQGRGRRSLSYSLCVWVESRRI